MLHMDVEDSEMGQPGIVINIDLNGVNNPSTVDMLALVNDILTSDVIQHIPWSGTATLNAVWIDSQTTLYPTE